MTIDRYTKFILTIIAIGIWTLAAAIFFQPAPIRATEEMQDVNIDRIGGYTLSDTIPVEIEGTVVIEFDEDPVFTIED